MTKQKEKTAVKFIDHLREKEPSRTDWKGKKKLTTDFITGGARYVFDGLDGWKQYDTSEDAHYFGIWVNPDRLEVLSYVEGDITLKQLKDKEAYNREIKRMNEFYEPGRIATVIDNDSGKCTEYRQDRKKFLID